MADPAASDVSGRDAARPRTVVEVIDATARWLAGRGVDAPRRSIELLLGRVLGMDRLQLYLAHDRPLGDDEKARLRPLVARRGDHEPLAYLLGDWEFFELELEVTPDVLIPRPETEGLVERALDTVCADVRYAVDLGTGCGAIAIALAHRLPELEVWAVDVSSAALEVAERNARRHGVDARVHFARGSWWEPLDAAPEFDLIVSNPPYVDPAGTVAVAEDVRRFEPATALFTEAGRPAAPYVAIAAGVRARARPGAVAWFETGLGADEAAMAALRDSGAFAQVELQSDFAGLPRYLRAVVA